MKSIYEQHIDAQNTLQEIEKTIQQDFSEPLGIDPIRIHISDDLRVTTTDSFIVVRQDDRTFQYRRTPFKVKNSNDNLYTAYSVSEKDTGRYYIIILPNQIS